MEIYSNKFWLKIFLVIVSVAIGLGSLIYTQNLVNILAEREEKLIDLYAKGLQQIAIQEGNEESITFLFQEIIKANSSIPVILSDANCRPISYKNIDIPKVKNTREKDNYLLSQIGLMEKDYRPIQIQIAPQIYNYIYYRHSFVLSQLRYYPIIQLSVIFVFILLSYSLFSYSRKAEQNRVWVGLAKETAHQLGTPLTSLMGWLEIFRTDSVLKDHFAVAELDKDIKRLNTVTARFSQIGSIPKLKTEDLTPIISEMIDYLSLRTSTKINFYFEPPMYIMKSNINKDLFGWVLENLFKNAIDAMRGEGKINVQMGLINEEKLFIDISDNGKGIPKTQLKRVFSPGFSTKARGWGLGLTLAKRIIESYHKGKIFVLKSEIGLGTTFRIILTIVE